MTWLELRRDIVIVACAISAGIHAALAPEHLRESAASGWGFIAAAALLAALSAALTCRPNSLGAHAAAVLVLAGLLASYALAVTSGVPFLHPEVEHADGLALTTKAFEAIGLVVSVDLIRPRRGGRVPFSLEQTGGVRA